MIRRRDAKRARFHLSQSDKPELALQALTQSDRYCPFGGGGSIFTTFCDTGSINTAKKLFGRPYRKLLSAVPLPFERPSLNAFFADSSYKCPV